MISFNGNKIVTTGGGGAILTNDKKVYLKLLKLISVNKEKHEFEYFYKSVGFNYKMPSINASLGLGQLNKINQMIKKKRKIFDIYEKIFKNFSGINILKEPMHCKSNYWLNTLILDKKYAKYKNKIIKGLIDKNFLCRPLWYPLHLSPHFKKSPRDTLDVTIDLYNRSINIPSSISILKNFK
jgi:perosamine synthetase